jgi:hypothetical protein
VSDIINTMEHNVLLNLLVCSGDGVGGTYCLEPLEIANPNPSDRK